MVRHGGSSDGSYLADATFPIPSHCASIAATSTLRVKHCQTEVFKHYALTIISLNLFVVVVVVQCKWIRSWQKCDVSVLQPPR